MEKIFNFRDMGGIPLADGKRVKSGIFFRASALDDASKNDIAALNAYGIRLIYDFRDGFEKESGKVYKQLNATYVNVPFMIDSARITKMHKSPGLKTLVQLENEDMIVAYRNMPFANESYRTLFRHIQNGDTPLLFHCTAGKDRTGVASAILLLLLGASREAIIADYLLTKKAEKHIIDKMRYRLRFLPFLRKKIVTRMMPVFLAEESFITAALDEIAAKYPTTEAYFSEEFSFTAQDIARMRALYTE